MNLYEKMHTSILACIGTFCASVNKTTKNEYASLSTVLEVEIFETEGVGSILNPIQGSLGAILASSWAKLEPSWDQVGKSWAMLGHLAHNAAILGHLGSNLGRSRGHLGPKVRPS